VAEVLKRAFTTSKRAYLAVKSASKRPKRGIMTQ